MHGLANTVLDYSRLDAGQMQYEDAPFDLMAETGLVIDLLQPQFDAKGITLCYLPQPHLPACVIGDPLRLRQILLNLLNNSFKFTQHGCVTLEVLALPSSGSTAKLRFTVHDTGMGIPGERLGAIFNAFEQSDASIGRRFGGAGLGLAITKMLVAQQGGQIGIDSKEGEGTTVWFELPFGLGDASKLQARETNTASIAPLQGKKVLVADDEPFNRRLLQEMLHSWAMECTLATNGKEALDLATLQHFDFILMDLRMPVMDGLEAVKRIRALPHASQTPIFMLSATTQQPEIEAGLATGCAVVLQKPFNETELLHLLLTYMPVARPVTATTEAPPIALQTAPPAAPHTAPQTAPRFSLKGLASMSRHNPSFFKDMVEGFIASAQRCRQEIRLGIQQQDLLQVGDAAHRLAAPAKHLEAQRLYAILKSLEHAGLSNGNWTQIHTAVEDLDQELGQLIPAIQMEMERV
jgi:CheY-like chemotaxis protein/HPt (histidine-containing phosphotransfer) domain-containing protein